MPSFKKHSQLIYAKKKKCAKMANVLWEGRAGIDKKKKLLLLLRYEVFSNNPFYGNQIILLSSCSYFLRYLL